MVWVSTAHRRVFCRALVVPGRLYVTVESGSKNHRTLDMDSGRIDLPGPAYLRAQVADHVARLEAEAALMPVQSVGWHSHREGLKRARRRARRP